MDDETKAYLDATEGRLMGRITTLQEHMLDRFRGIDATMAAHTELMRSTNMLVTGYGDHGRRITDLEK